MHPIIQRVVPGWGVHLEQVKVAAQTKKSAGVIAFDLDSTLFDNLPRQAQIIREFGSAQKLPLLDRVEAADFTDGWTMRAPLRNVGLPDSDIERIYPALKSFWAERFFTSPYCLLDVAIRGAADYVQSLYETGVQVAYITGRHEPMRDGTIGCLAKWGFPTPSMPRVRLIMKPTLAETDDDFKLTAHAEFESLGAPIAAFDNEPMHINDYHKRFGSLKAVHLATDHSPREIQVLESIPSIPHFDPKFALERAHGSK